MQSQETSGGNDNDCLDTANGGPISQETIDIAAKIVDAQASLVTEVEMRKQPLAAGASVKGANAKSAVGDATGACPRTQSKYRGSIPKSCALTLLQVQMGL